MFGGLEKKHEIGPLGKEEIAKLPVVLYIPSPETKEKESTGSGEKPANDKQENQSSQEALPTTTAMRKADKETPPSQASLPTRRPRRFLRLLFKRHRETKSSDAPHASNGIYVSTPHPLHPLPDNLSSCPICLGDYEPPPLLTAAPEEQRKGLAALEPLNLLPCQHAIHKDCLAPWLQTSGRCPVCQRAILESKEDKAKETRSRRRAESNTPSVNSDETEVAEQEMDRPQSVISDGTAVTMQEEAVSSEGRGEGSIV